jgi:hypothetical protein
LKLLWGVTAIVTDPWADAGEVMHEYGIASGIINPNERLDSLVVVNKDVKPYALMVGVPARQIGWMSEFGEQIPLPLQGEGTYTWPHSGLTYALSEGFLTR